VATTTPRGPRAKPTKTNRIPMLTKIKKHAKDPVTYVILVIGGVLALAIPKLGAILTPVAKVIPGSKA
jgi:hypothetical protein